MLGVLIAVVLSALVIVLCALLGLPAVLGIAVAFLILVSGIGSGGLGLRPGDRDRF
jgi:hypothetical protein